MFRFTTLSIRSLLVLITVVVALPAAGIIVYSGIQFRDRMLVDARVLTLNLSERLATEQQNLVAGVNQLMTVLAQLPEVKDHDTAKVEPILRELRKLNPMYENIFIADRNGTVWATAEPVDPPFVVSDRRYFQNALASGKLSSGEFIVSRSTKKPTFNLAYPLKDADGGVIGVVGVGFSLDQYGKLFGNMHFPVGTSFVLIDHRGVILYRAIAPEKYTGKPYLAQEFRKMKEGPEWGTSFRLGLTGDRRIISYRKLYLDGEQEPYMYVTAGIPLDVATRAATRSLIDSVVLLMSFLLLGCVIALLIGKRAIVDRFRMLEDASQRLAGGDLQVRVSDVVVGGELGSLGKSFDAMAIELARREAERLRADRDRDRLITMLENANQELEAFNYTVAHDLRQPLNLLNSNFQAIEYIFGDQLPEECKGYVRDAYHITLRMNRLIEALLNFSRMGQVELYREVVDLSMLAQEVVRSRQRTEPERQVDLRIASGVSANGDRNLLMVVMDNLLGNAWKYTSMRETAIIEFGVSSVDGVPTYFVRDNGAGFDMAEAKRMFIPFQRLPGAEQSKGFGIGLATVDRIIRRHGGKVWAEGEPGKGACVYFTLSPPE